MHNIHLLVDIVWYQRITLVQKAPHCNGKVSLTSPEVAKMITSSAVSDEYFAKMTTFRFCVGRTSNLIAMCHATRQLYRNTLFHFSECCTYMHCILPNTRYVWYIQDAIIVLVLEHGCDGVLVSKPEGGHELQEDLGCFWRGDDGRIQVITMLRHQLGHLRKNSGRIQLTLNFFTLTNIDQI